MDEGMAPPIKRRKLSANTSLELHRDNSIGPLKPQPSFSHSVQSISAYTPLAPPWTIRPTTAVHENLQQAALRDGEARVILPRQGTGAIVSVSVEISLSVTLPSFITGIQTFTDATTTLTFTPPATPSLPTLPSVPGATTFSTTQSSNNNASLSTTASPSLSEPPTTTPASSLNSSLSVPATTSASLTLPGKGALCTLYVMLWLTLISCRAWG